MQEGVLIECHTTIDNKQETWQANLKSIMNYGDYYEATIEARSTYFNMLVGKTDNYDWVALPTQKVSCSLANPNDTFWNEERLSVLIGAVDATTIATVISFIDRHKDILFGNSITKRPKSSEGHVS